MYIVQNYIQGIKTFQVKLYIGTIAGCQNHREQLTHAYINSFVANNSFVISLY